ncbi:MAG: c-type cytochrome [Hyphomicrobiaceae bacterium]
MAIRRPTFVFTASAMVLTIAFGWAGLPSPGLADDTAAAGEKILKEKCATCHALGRDGASPNKAAPPFRDLHLRYPVSHLAEALAEGIVTGHNDMPEFTFTPDEISAILAYMETLAAKPPVSR